METLSIPMSIKRSFNVFEHLFGYVKKHLLSEEKQRVLSVFKDFREGISQYMIPVEIINLLVHKYSVESLYGHD